MSAHIILQFWKFKYTVTDIKAMKEFTVQFMKEMNMKWRKDGVKKTFMERLVNLAAERVRRNLMPNFKKKNKRNDDSKSHQSKRSKTLTNTIFDPSIHVKEDQSGAMDGITVTTSNDPSVSSVTDKDQEDSMVLMIEKYYKDNNTRLLPIEIFEACRKAKPGYVEEGKIPIMPLLPTPEKEPVHQAQKETNNKVETVLQDGTCEPKDTEEGILGMDLQNMPNTFMAPGQGIVERQMPQLQVVHEMSGQSNDELIEPFRKCENTCEFKLEINNNPHESTIEKDFGKGMRCVGAECGKTLLECFKTKNINSAYVCTKCRTGDCKHMYCCGCFAKTGYAITKERTRKKRGVQF